jgi:DNA (cytosine-5)-methyltransferase 1
VNVVGLFAGIGGLELGFRQAGFKTRLLCEIDDECGHILAKRFKNVPLIPDIAEVTCLSAADIVTAGFPCQSFSQAGLTRGLASSRPLISELLRLIRTADELPRYVVLENVPNIVHLAGGEALRYITRVLEPLGYTWAYRIVDTSAFGLPQRRARWFFVASLRGDAPTILLEQDARSVTRPTPRAHGFYWTEGNRGLGWADDAVPPLKSGSTVGIPSPPAIWMVEERAIVKPTIRDAERLQGFPAGWTDSEGSDTSAERRRWRMVGNAVSVPTAQWIARRIAAQLSAEEPAGHRFLKTGRWPRAAWGRKGERYEVRVSAFPYPPRYTPILDFLTEVPEPLSMRATRGFRGRLEASSLRYPAAFLDALRHHERAAAAFTVA